MDEKAAFHIPANFSLTPLKLSQIPAESSLLSDAQALLDATLSWTLAETYPNGRTYVHSEYEPKTKKTQTWHCVVTELPKNEISFSQLWAKLGRNKAWNQKSYVAGIDKVSRVKYISEWQSIWTTLFIHPPPMSPRVYTVYQVSRLQEFSYRRRGFVVTLPIDLASKTTRDLAELEEKGIKGRYVSVEHIREMDDEKLEWRQVVGVDARGFIPKFWVHRKMGRNLLQEFAACVQWLKDSRPEDIKDDSGEDEETQSKPDKNLKKGAQIQTEEYVVDEIDYRQSGTNTQTT